MFILFILFFLVLLYMMFLILPSLFFTSFFLSSFKALILLGVDFVSCSSLGVVLTVILVTFFVVMFASFYMKTDNTLVYFLFMIVLFVFSMLILSCSNSLFFIFIGWDGLGVTSFILIMYYNNWKSMNNSVFTLLSNRVGDSLMLLFFGLIIWDFSVFNFVPFCGVLLIIFIFMTKSAQTPISAWLPAAMAAPTPVSALVHSSTLVTAGIVFVLKFYFLAMSCGPQKLLLFIGMMTIFVAGLTAFLEMDFKKLVALSTLSQMGMLVLVLGLGSKWLCVFHLISHAFFKSCLFLIVGGGLHFVFSKQDWRGYNSLMYFSSAQSLVLFLCCVCLCGLFFTSGFMSKDMILDFMTSKQTNFLMIFLFLFGLVLTFIYCLRLFYCFFKKSTYNGGVWFSKQHMMMELSPLFLLLMSLSLCYWMFFSWQFFFSSLVSEKNMLLLFIVLFIFVLMLNLMKTVFLKTMFMLDVFYKKMSTEKMKMSNKKEKSFLDYFLNVGLISPQNSFIKLTVSGFAMKTLYIVVICFMFLFFVIFM